jgi:hypothetical protein
MSSLGSILSFRGSSHCRACGQDSLREILDLGAQPLPSEYGVTADQVLDSFPLCLRICVECGLGQLGEYVFPERIFHKNYPYISSASATWVNHSRQFAIEMKSVLNLDSDSLVIELASNDGYLLSEMKALGIQVLGVEPASMVAKIAKARGIPTLTEFFGANAARKIVREYGMPKLVIANNVFAHVPDLSDFTEGIAILANEETVVTIENPSFCKLLTDNLFDTVYHEHYSYLSAHAVKAVTHKFGLNLFRVEQLQTHGGSNRYWLSKSKPIEDSVRNILEEEVSQGLFQESRWESFAANSFRAIESLRQWFEDRNHAGDVVVGYGAAHKGNTFLNAVGAASKVLAYVVDASPEKQGKFLPGSRIPVLPPDQLAYGNPSDVLILPWNISRELAERVKVLVPKARIWVAQPYLHRL